MTTQAPTKALTGRQILFATAVASGKSYTDAAILAGYSQTVAHEKAHRIAILPHVRDAITHQLQVRQKGTELSADWWRTELAYQYQRCRDASQAGDALRALELAGKHLGLLDTRSDQGGAEALGRVLSLLAARALPAPDLTLAHAGGIGTREQLEGGEEGKVGDTRARSLDLTRTDSGIQVREWSADEQVNHNVNSEPAV